MGTEMINKEKGSTCRLRHVPTGIKDRSLIEFDHLTRRLFVVRLLRSYNLRVGGD